MANGHVGSLVVDVCVAVKWFVEEVEAEKARSLLTSGLQLIAPDLFVAELGSALLKKVRQGEMTADAVLAALASIELVVTLLPSLAVAGEAFDLASRYNRSFYDALYVALAVREGCQVVTADEKLINGMGAPFRDRFLLLSDAQAGAV